MKCFVFGSLSLLLSLLSVLIPTASYAERPNMVLIMVDDLGYSDFGCYGSEIDTPNIDALAAQGLRFSRFYNTAKCHSSRVSLLTGLYCNQAGSNKLNRGVTIAEVLGNAGYATAMVGKWHLANQPTDRGFQKYFGHLSGATNFFTGDDTFRLNGAPWNEFDDDFYTTDAWLEYGNRFLREMIDEDANRPFFLYIAHNAPHYPLHARKADVLKYQGKYDEGWDVIRARRHTKQLDMGLVPASWKLSPRPDHVPAWDELTDKEKRWDARRMEAFAAMVDRVDQVTGKMIDFLKQHGKYENTLIMICSDNGACPFDRTKGAKFEPWDSRSYWCYDTGWSHVGNTPFRLHKQNQHEGGIASPMIAHWPAGLKAQAGSITDQPGHLIDFMATALDLAQTDYPKKWPGIELEPLQGKSLVPIFEGKTREPHACIYQQFGDNQAIRVGDWKLVTHRRSSWELYNIAKDGTEMNNLAEAMPGKVKELEAIWIEMAKQDRLSSKYFKPLPGTPPPKLAKKGTPIRSGKQPNNKKGMPSK